MIKIEKRGYLGIDESNHGRFPEIYVGVFSLNECSIRPGKYAKKRKKKRIENILDPAEDYKHLIIKQGYRDIFGGRGIKIIALAEIIGSFKNLNRIIFDGFLDQKELMNLERILYPINIDLHTESDADRHFKIVSKADQIAYRLYNYYTNQFNINNKKKYIGTLIDLDIKKYLKYIPIFE